MDKGKVTIRYEENVKALAVKAMLGLGLAYLFASLAIDSGSLIQYGLTILAAAWGLKALVRAIRATIKN